MHRAVAMLTGIALLGSLPAVAQNDDPFRSAAPPSQDPFKMAPPDPAPKPAPVPRSRAPEPVIAAPPPAPAPVAQWDGLWTGTFHCNTSGAQPEVTYKVAMRVSDNAIARANAFSQTPGTPGYDAWSGRINPDGSVTIDREGIGVGLIAGTAPRGARVSQTIQGRFSGNSFIGWIPALSARGCGVSMTRAN